MAFKMKGSAFKLGSIATKSVLKQASPMKHPGDVEQLQDPKGGRIFGHEGKEYTPEELDKHHAPTKMKSPVKQLSSYPCPECQAVFELPEDLVEHMDLVHLSGDTGTGTPGSDYAGVKRNRGGGKKKKGLFRRR